jgi:excisionase family DNA binding protein
MYHQNRTDKPLKLLLEQAREAEKKNQNSPGSYKKNISLTPQLEYLAKKFAKQAGEDIGEIVSILIYDQILEGIDLVLKEKMLLQSDEGIEAIALADPQELLTGSEVASILKISKGMAYQLMQRGDIPAVRINRTVRVRRKDLLDFIDSSVEDRQY